jgi:hypothetical protein
VHADKTSDHFFIDVLELKAALVFPSRKVRNASDIRLDRGVRVLAEPQIIDIPLNMRSEVALEKPVTGVGMKAWD